MQKRALGNSNLEVSAIGLGCMGMSQNYGPPPGDRQDMISLIHAAVDRGITFFDTAESYGPWTNEELVGEALCEELGIGFVPYSPLGKGFLTGTIDATTSFADNDIRMTIPRFSPEARHANRALVDLIAKLAHRKGSTPSQIALAWLLAQKASIVPIPGTRKLERLEENIAAAEVQLTPDDLREIESVASQITIQGARYPADLEQMTYR